MNTKTKNYGEADSELLLQLLSNRWIVWLPSGAYGEPFITDKLEYSKHTLILVDTLLAMKPGRMLVVSEESDIDIEMVKMILKTDKQLGDQLLMGMSELCLEDHNKFMNKLREIDERH